MRQYEDFDLSIEPGDEGSYRVRVLNSPAGQADGSFEVPFGEMELENFLLKIGRSRGSVRRLESPETEAAREFGTRLFDSVFAEEIGTQWRRSLDAVEREELGLRIRLRLDDVPELNDLPWEFLHSKATDRFVVLSSWTPLVRYISLDRGADPLTVAPPLRILAMVSSPTDYPPLDVEAEWRRLDESLGEMAESGLVEITRLEEPTLRALQRALRRDEDYHIFHFIGHGGFDERADDGLLLLENDMGRAREVSGHDLGTILLDARTIRLAVLNSCEGARTSAKDPLAGAAQSLVFAGVDAVVAMQFEISDRAAIVFAHEFYAALADGFPVDAAMAEARRAIFGANADVEWGTPVLHMRSEDGRLFEMMGEPVPTVTNVEIVEPAVEVEDTPPEPVPVFDADAAPATTVAPEPEAPVESEPAAAEPVDAPADDADHEAVEHVERAVADDGLEEAPADPVMLSPIQDAPPTSETVRSPQVDEPPPHRRFGAGLFVGIAIGVIVILVVWFQVLDTGDGDDAGVVVDEDAGVVLGEEAPGETVIVELQVADTPQIVSTPTATPIVVDGNLADWSFVDTAFEIRHEIFRHPDVAPLGIGGRSSMFVAHDAAALHIGVAVDDDVYSQLNVGNQIWRGDAITINLSTGAAGDAITSSDFQLTMTPQSAAGVPEVVLFTGGGSGRFGPNTTDVPVNIAGIIDPAGAWTFEATIPWSVFGLSGEPAGELTALFNVFDNDGELLSDGQPAQTLILANVPDAGFQKPSTWGTLDATS